MHASDVWPPFDPKPAPRTRSPWPTRIAITLLALGIPILLFLGYIGKLGNNFREIAPGKAYRSAQMKADSLAEAIQQKKIKSVINLRGERGRSDWYTAELAACQAAEVDHVDINIGLGALPPPEAVQKLIERLVQGPYPILMHCRAGSDRTGLGSVFYVHIVEKRPLEQAEAEQLNWHYGHFEVGAAKSINEFFKLYHETADGQSLMAWCYQSYPALYAKLAKNQTPVKD